MQSKAVVTCRNERIPSRCLLSDAALRRAFSPGSVPVPGFGRDFSPRSRPGPGRRPGLQSPVPVLGCRTGGQSQWLCVADVLSMDPDPGTLFFASRRLRTSCLAYDSAASIVAGFGNGPRLPIHSWRSSHATSWAVQRSPIIIYMRLCPVSGVSELWSPHSGIHQIIHTHWAVEPVFCPFCSQLAPMTFTDRPNELPHCPITRANYLGRMGSQF